MKVLYFSYAFISCFGGFAKHDGFWTTAIFIVLFGVNYLISMKNDDLNEAIVNFFAKLVAGLHPVCKDITDAFFRYVSHALCWIGYFAVEESAAWWLKLILAIGWGLWGVATLVQMMSGSGGGVSDRG